MRPGIQLGYPLKLLFHAMLAYPKIGPQYAIKRNDRATEQQFILFILFLKA